MTHEPIRVIRFTPHITWQGTQAELDDMLADGWPDGKASDIIKECQRDAAEARAYAAELEAKLAWSVELLSGISGIMKDVGMFVKPVADAIAELKGNKQ